MGTVVQSNQTNDLLHHFLRVISKNLNVQDNEAMTIILQIINMNIMKLENCKFLVQLAVPHEKKTVLVKDNDV